MASGTTEFTVNSPLAVQVWSPSLEVEAEKKLYFKKFMGTGQDAMIRIKQELQKSAGDTITVAMRRKLTGAGVRGDNPIEGTSAVQALAFYDMSIKIDQIRMATGSKGRMSEQRVPYNMRKECRDALSTWHAEEVDEEAICYLSGARGVDTSFHNPAGWPGEPNTFDTPDSNHIVYGGDATAKNDLDESDIVDLTLIDRLVAKADTIDPAIMPFMMNGEKRFVFLMHIFTAFDLRKPLSNNDWTDIQKRVNNGKNIFEGALGMHHGVVLHEHRNVIRFSDYGSGGDVTAARNLFLGAQAGAVAWGGNGSGLGKYTWVEKLQDADNRLEVYAGQIMGFRGAYFNSEWIGRFAVDTYYDDPT